ncbi:MAG: LD-carboxypeptidase [Zetaproteobacteria bacterium]|nr:MAG: LD-carboxypeptidase [Zetaproteobacteria bacterium]
MSIHPPALKAGDTIGVFSPSSWVEREDIEKSKALLKSRGFKVFVHPQTYEREHQSAGNHLQKSLAFQGLWQRKDIKAIWAAGGGNRCTHLIESINFRRLNTSPKILIGFSDVTSLLNAIYAQTNITTFHGPVFKNLHRYKQLDHLIDLLSAKRVTYPITDNNILRSGKAKGHLIGGNLSVFQYLPQTLPNEFYKDGILFLEDCNEELSRIDRMLLHLKRLGVLNDINALVFGQFTDMQETGKPFGYRLKDIIEEHTEGMQYPILHNMPFGHGKDLYTFPIGTRAEIDTEANKFTLLDPATTTQ